MRASVIRRLGACACAALLACAALATPLPTANADAAQVTEDQSASVQIVYEVVDDGADTVTVPKRAAANAEPPGTARAAWALPTAKTGDILQSWQLYALAAEAALALTAAAIARRRRGNGEER